MAEHTNDPLAAALRSFVPLHVAQDLAAHPFASPLLRVQRFDAVALFADVSGFTPMSEALAQSGRAGAEELTSILNSYFEPMIARVQSFGGSVGKFGGDAMTVLFPYTTATRHLVARQALRCALEMQAAMPAYAAISTSAGEFGLAMKAGLALGSVLCTSVGDPGQQLEYVIAGGLLDRCAEAEHHATRGEVVAHRDLLAAAEITAPAEWRGSFGLLKPRADLVAPLATLISAPAVPEALLVRYVHPAIASRVRSGQDEFVNEHRSVTVLFVRFEGFDYDGDPEVAGKLQAYLAALLAVVARYDGYLSRVDMGDKGSKAIVLFGAPVIHEDDAERALRCALELVQVPGAEARVGVNSGFVFAGCVGSAVRREYTVMGDPVNLAARLMQAAQAGQVLVGEATRRAVGPGFDWATLQALAVKGKAQPVQVALLHGLAARGAATQLLPVYRLPLVGRQPEREQALNLIQAAHAGQGQVLIISGDAGIGKSRLAAEVLQLADAAGFRAYTGSCQSYGVTSSYLVWRDVWRGLLGLDAAQPSDEIAMLERALAALDTRLLPRAPLLGPLLGLAVPDTALTASFDPGLRAELLRALLLECLRLQARAGPLLLLLDDCHWIDALSQELLEYLGRNLHELPLLLVVLLRPDSSVAPLAWAQRLPHFSHMALHELNLDEARTLAQSKIAQLFPQAHAPPADMIAQLIARAQGNPFYLEELLNYLQAQEARGEDGASLELPNSLHNLILSRIDQLDASKQATLKVASVVGRSFKVRWVWGSYPQIGTSERVEQQLQQLSRLDLTALERAEPELEYLFRQSTTQEVAYATLALATRASLHEAVATFVEDRYVAQEAQYLDVLAYHYGRSPNQAKQRLYFHKAATAAKASYANAAALEYYQRLLPLLADDEQAAVRCDMAEIWQLTGNWPEAERAFRQVLASGDPRLAARARSGLGQLYAHTHSYDEALPWLAEARASFAALGDAHGESQVLQQLSFAYIQQGEHAQALATAQQQLDLALAQADQAGASAALGNIGLVYSDQGDLAQALTYLRLALDAATAGNHRRGAILVGSDLAGVYWQLGDYAEALECLRQALAEAHEIGYRQLIGLSLGNAGLLYDQLGDAAQALACYARGLAIALELGDWPNILPILGNIALIFTGQGQFHRADKLYRAAVELGRSLQMPYILCDSLYHWAELHLLQADWAAALPLVRDAERIASSIQNRETQFKASLLELQLLAALGEQAQAVAGLELLAATCDDESEQAAWSYARWWIEQDSLALREDAARRYKALYAQTPNVDYRQRYAVLTGQELPASTPLPALPAALLGPAPNLEALLATALELIARLRDEREHKA